MQQETQKTLVPVKVPVEARAVGILRGEKVPSTINTEQSKTVYKQPSCIKRCLRRLFCVPAKQQA